MSKILIIEDDISLATTLVRRLTKFGHQCEHTDQGSKALLLCRSFMPDVLLVDMKLQDESGLKLIPLFRNSLPNSKIILMTGYASIATAVDAIKLGANEYLAKPIDTQTLISAIEGKPIKVEQAPPEQRLTSEQLEWEHINQVLKFNGGNISETARQLSMHRRTLQRKLSKRPSFNKVK